MLSTCNNSFKYFTFTPIIANMNNKLITLVTLILAIALQSYGNTPDLYLVYVRGKVSNIENGEPIPNAHVINSRSRSGTTTNADGVFTLQMLTDDTLTIRVVGFVEEDFFINEFPPKNLYEISMKPVRYLLDEVEVSDTWGGKSGLGLPEAKPLNVPVELRGSAFHEDPPWYAAILSPIAYLQYHTSSSEKEKRTARNIILNEEQWKVFSRYHNLETIEKITGLWGDAADKFMLYCNMHNQLPYNAPQMEIEYQIRALYEQYKIEQEENHNSQNR